MPKFSGSNRIVNSAQFEAGTVDADAIGEGAVGASEIATDAVDAAEIKAGAVGADEIATDAVDAAEIKAGAVGTSEIANDSVINEDIKSDAAIADTKLAQITTAGKVSGAALTLLANIPVGAGVIPAANLPGNVLSRPILEAIAAGQVPMNVTLLKAALADTASGNYAFGGNSSIKHKVAIPIIGNGVAMTSLTIGLRKEGSPTNNYTLRIETDSTNAPSGTLADANATGGGSSAALTGSNADTTIALAGSITLSNGVKYWIVLDVDGSYSDTNYVHCAYKNSGAIQYFPKSTHNGTSWTTDTSWNDIPAAQGSGFYISGIVKNTLTALSAVHPGIVTIGGAVGAMATIAGRGAVATGLSGLSPGGFYTGSATPGVLGGPTLTPAADQIGQALSETEMLVTCEQS